MPEILFTALYSVIGRTTAWGCWDVEIMGLMTGGPGHPYSRNYDTDSNVVFSIE